jgi:hypothetical protein
MILKEAFRYMNYLDELMNSAFSYIQTPSFMTKTNQLCKNKRDKDGNEHEEKNILPKSIEVSFQPQDVIDIIDIILDEKEKLSNAIWTAKGTAPFDIDKMVAINSQKRKAINEFTRLAKMNKSTLRQSEKRGYIINANGEQTPYFYDVEEITTIDFDRTKVKQAISRLTKEADKNSHDIDLCLLTTEVDYEQKWDITMTLVDILEKSEE